jgi:hypothetical protein
LKRKKNFGKNIQQKARLEVKSVVENIKMVCYDCLTFFFGFVITWKRSPKGTAWILTNFCGAESRLKVVDEQRKL